MGIIESLNHWVIGSSHRGSGCGYQSCQIQAFPRSATCHWRTDLAMSLRLPLPDVAFSTDKKLAPNWSLTPPKRWLCHTETSCHWRTGLCQQPPSLQNAGFAACFSMSCWLLPLASYSFLCFLSSCSILSPLLWRPPPAVGRGRRIYVCIYIYICIIYIYTYILCVCIYIYI